MQTINLDISRKHSTAPIYAKQCEVGRKFLAVITDNGLPYNIPNDALLSVWYEGDTDAGNYSSIEERSAFSIDSNKVTVELVAQMLLKPGNGKLCLSLSYGDGREVNTWNIPYVVEYKPGSGSFVPTEYYTALTEAAGLAAAQVGLAREQADIAVAAAAQLVGLPELLIPVGYTFQWSPVAASGIDLTTPEKVAAHFGFGTWEQITDRFIVGAGGKYEAGATGGRETTTLSVGNLPSHNHKIPVAYMQSGTTDTGDLIRYDNTLTSSTGNKLTENTGNGEAFSIMPPYVAMYIWKRVA